MLYTHDFFSLITIASTSLRIAHVCRASPSGHLASLPVPAGAGTISTGLRRPAKIAPGSIGRGPSLTGSRLVFTAYTPFIGVFLEKLRGQWKNYFFPHAKRFAGFVVLFPREKSTRRPGFPEKIKKAA